ncbi:MAG TPA: hypothetical protein VFE32_06065 [Puia sp.]|jgi:hypothetical protein|nr:hypothetical protein [Puia sp.]
MKDQIISEGKDGLSQSDRLLWMLLPGHVAIDNRDAAALMLRATRLAEYFIYYNSANEADGNWQDFFLSDFNILMLMIPALDFGPSIRSYEMQVAQLRLAPDEDSFRRGSQGLTDAVAGLADLLVKLMERLNAVTLPAAIVGRISKILGSVQDIRKLVVALRTAVEAIETRQEQTKYLVEQLHNCFSNLLIQYNRVQEIANYYRRDTDWSAEKYPPHLALLITFLHLYRHVSAQLNGLTKAHLNMYYQQILGLPSLPEIPDRVHLLFIPEANAGHIHLPAGEIMLAEIPGQDEPLRYQLSMDLIVTKAAIAMIRTLFTGSRSIFPDDVPEHRLILNTQLYQGSYSPVSPEALLKGNAATCWPLFGEDQEELAIDQRTMSDAAVGLLLASPVFYLPEGARTIRITFQMTASSFMTLSSYMTQFAEASQKTVEAAQHELLSRVFVIEVTVAGEWAVIEKYSVRALQDNNLEVCMELGVGVKPVTGYQPGIHGPDLKTSLPVVRLLINSGAPHNGLSFFSDLKIERVHLQSQVRHFRKVKLQNSIGNLSAESAFQPWGPLPAVGSYLDIKNTNVFNRYTTDVALRLEWMDLPKDPGGFGTWYAGYDAGITDDSFRIGVSALVNGSQQPPVARQQSFQLYTPNSDDIGSGPEPVTLLQGIDMKKLDFTNMPLLGKEDEEAEGFFRNGAIRIELLSPPAAYGHTLFPRLFPEVAMYNARWWHKRRPLPNQPYTPRAKSVSVNYTLQYAEAFKDPQDTNGGLELIHQYPFGFRRVYPGSDLRMIRFLPVIDPGGHVHIGLTNAGREEEISLLFQLEERNFHPTLNTGDTVTWSYLQDEEWVPIGASGILSDMTNNFINTGIVRLKLPARIPLANSTWPSGLFWLRASLKGTADLNSRVVAISAQAVVAERMPDQGNTGISVPPGAISNGIRKVQGLKQVVQPFASYGGRQAEQDEAYYIRVSERLRHKRRPLTAMDIEQLVLARFPSIAVVKCIGAGHRSHGIYPGVDLRVILIPQEGTDGNFNADQPKANLATLNAVKNFLAGFASPFINIEIGNPVYERVKIACRIRLANPLKDDVQGSEGYYLKRLDDDIRRYFCPWIFSPGLEVKIGTRIYLSELMTHIRRLPYIAEVTGFSVVHFFSVRDRTTGELKSAVFDSAVDGQDYIQGSVPEAVLIPSDHHLIRLLTKGDFVAPATSGIGDFSVGDELLLFHRHRRQVQHEGYDEEPESREDPDQRFDLTIDPKKYIR